VSGRQPGNNPESHKLSGQVLINAVTGEVKFLASGNATNQKLATVVIYVISAK
jgi:hypothetical protein